MRLPFLTAAGLAAAMAVAPLAASPQDKDDSLKVAKSREITLRGCVVPGQDKDTFVMTHVTEVPPAGGSVIPESAHGRRVVFWLDKDDDILKHANAAVEVHGTFDGFEESEIELKAGKKDGGLIAEFEGPGEDVKVPNEAVSKAIGTTGRTEPEKNDIKTMLVKVDVKDVKAVDYSCRDQK